MFFFKWLQVASVVFSQSLNFMTGGDPTMTLSARAAYARQEGSKSAERMCHVLDWVDPRDGDAHRGDHCDIAAASDFERALKRQGRKP